MKILKKIIALGLSMTLFMNQASYAAYTNGFTYDEKIYTRTQFSSARMIRVYRNSDLIGTLEYKVGRLINKNKVNKETWENTVVTHMIMEPEKNESAKKWGVSQYCSCRMILPSKDYNDWAPKNEVPKDNWSFSINNSGVSASTETIKSRLEFEADVRPSKQTAAFKYDYKPYRDMLDFSKSKNKYFRNTSDQYCMVSVNTKKYSWIKFEFKATFTYSEEKYCIPNDIHGGSSEGELSYTWMI